MSSVKGSLSAFAVKLLGGLYSNTVSAASLTADRTLNIPDKSGTLALTNKSVAVTAVSVTLTLDDEHIHVTAAGQTITLPSAPVVGMDVCISVEAFTSTIIARNGKNIMSLSENMTIDKAGAAVSLRYISASRGWQIV